MNFRIKIKILFIFLISTSNVFAQTVKNFTQDAEKFPLELQSFLEDADKKQANDMMEEFNLTWSSGKFSSKQKESIIKTANAMLKKRLKAIPDFFNYVSTLNTFAKSSQSTESFSAWQSSLEKLLQLPARHFSSYLVICRNLFRDNTLYESPSTNWHSNNSNYSFEFDSVPKIIFPSLSLICSARGDSSIINETKGFLYPTLHVFYGTGGKVDWNRAGWDPTIIKAELKNFVIDVSGSEFSADSVVFYNSTYFNSPLIGKYTDKILANTKPENASYPRFESYTTGLSIKNVVPDVDYRGGFSMHGNRMLGSGTSEDNATLTFYREKKPFLLAQGLRFSIRKEQLTSDNASVKIFFEKDSIYHPGVTFKYIVKDREVALIRGEEGKSKSPYFDSFHAVDMYFDGLYWKIDEPLINLKMISGTGESKATFESSNYFRQHRFLRLQGLSEIHPLFSIKQYATKHDTKIIYTEDLAKEMRMPDSEIRSLLIRLSNEGFVTYDANDDKITVKDKLYYYLLANTGKTDYDVIQFESIISAQSNASINLLNFEMTLRGLAPIILSDSQNVVLYPKDQEIKLHKDRDFDFAGRVHAGRFDFYGKSFSFDYHNFKINLDNVDSLRLKVESEDPSEVDEYGRRKLLSVKSVLENITGDLLVDFQGNKSGKQDYPNYPIFNSKKDSYVNYDKASIQNGVYDKDKFFFHLDPFTIDSLDNFSRAGLKFNGEFVSAGIFADFRDTLRLQTDLSLGLTRSTGPEGWAAYGGKGNFTNKLNLSNEGLHGDGTLTYLTSTAESDDFLFLPDSMNSDVNKFNNKKETIASVEFPSIKAENVYVHWEPKNDFMDVRTKEVKMDMYDGQASLKGGVKLKPSGLEGDGIMTFVGSELESTLFKYKGDDFGADTSEFRLSSDNSEALAITTKNVNSKIDFKKRIGEFNSNGGGSFVNFPLNQYVCFIDRFKWFMDEKEIEFSSNDQDAATDTSSGVSLQGSEFISIEPRQDSLRWKAPYARYSLRDYLIKAEKVALIQTADALVLPDSGKVVVERYAKMRTLKDARIVANTITKYHSIYNATVDILGRKKYEGSGDYDYIDENDIKHNFHLSKIGVDSVFQTYADGELTDTAGFPLSPEFLFKGNVHLSASQEFLTFSGYAKPNVHCEKIQKNWIRFSNEINPDKIYISFNTPVTDNGTKLSAAIAQTSDSTGIYAAFLMPKQRVADLELISASGVLYYDKEFSQFRITTKEKLLKPGIAGNFLSLDDKKCFVFGEGKLDFGSDLGQVTLQTVGTVNNNLNNDNTTFDLLATIDFFFSDDALKIMSTNLANSSSVFPTQDAGRPTFEKGLTELIGKEKADKLLSELNLYGAFKKIPEELRHTLFFTELKLVWNNTTRSYRSEGPIGLGSIDKTNINRKINGSIEIIHKKSGDAINIYLEPDNAQWYFFSYSRGLMQAISSVSTFNDEINKMKPEKRVSKVKDKADFEFIMSTERAVKNYLKKVQGGK
jgi:hypothetical protein